MSELPHVTKILMDSGLVDARWYTDEARDRGSALHKATEFYDQGELDYESVDELLVNKLAAYMKFIEDKQPKIIAIEEKVRYPRSYQGTLDRRLYMNDRECIFDIKSGVASPADRLQLAGYALTFERPMQRWNLYLGYGSNYRLVQHKNTREDDADWRACLRVARLRREHNLVN